MTANLQCLRYEFQHKVKEKLIFSVSASPEISIGNIQGQAWKSIVFS